MKKYIALALMALLILYGCVNLTGSTGDNSPGDGKTTGTPEDKPVIQATPSGTTDNGEELPPLPPD